MPWTRDFPSDPCVQVCVWLGLARPCPSVMLLRWRSLYRNQEPVSYLSPWTTFSSATVDNVSCSASVPEPIRWPAGWELKMIVAKGHG